MRRPLIGGLVATALFAALSACASTPRRLDPDPTLVGRRFVGTLEGATTRAARLISTRGEHEFAVHHVVMPRGERLIVTRLVGRDSAGRPEYEVLAAAELPRLRRDELLVLSACALNGTPDVDLVAIAVRDSGPELRRLRAVWRASGEEARLAPIPRAGVVCENESARR